MSNDWKPLTQTPKPLKHRITSSDKNMWQVFYFSRKLPISDLQPHTCRQQMSRGMWAMMTLLDVLDCNFSDSFMHKFSAPERRHPEDYQDVLQPASHWYQLYWSPCSSLTVHTIRSTQAAFAWQRSLRGLCSTDNPVESWSTRCSSDWLLLNCSSTKSCTSRTNDGCRAKKQQASESTAETACGLDDEYVDGNFYLSCSTKCPSAF